MKTNLRIPNAVDETPSALLRIVALPASPSVRRGVRARTQFVGFPPDLTKTLVAAQDKIVPHIQSKLKVDVVPKNKMYNLI